MTAYATVRQYRDWSGDQLTPDSIVSVKLDRATEDIDQALIAAVYQTDSNGMPVDAVIIDVLQRATSAQAQYLLAVNDDAGVKREFSSVSAGGVSVSRSGKPPALPPVGPRALQILRTAGAQPAAALIGW